MKRITGLLMTVLMVAGMASCGKDDKESVPAGNQDLPTYESLVNTEWNGTYQTYANSPMGTIPATLDWTLDFAADGQLDVMFRFLSQATSDAPIEMQGSYTYDPATGTGTITTEDFQDAAFSVDAVNRTMKAHLTIITQHEAGGPDVSYGGETTLHQVR